jgi:hypothetical protein
MMDASATRRLGSAVIAIVLASVAASCTAGGDATSNPTAPESTTNQPSTATAGQGSLTPGTNSGQPAAAVPEVLRFTAPRLSGGTVQGASLAGSDVALWFWAPW